MISVIIPTLDAAPRITTCLAALGPAVMEAMLADVVIADGGSSDDIAAIAEATGAVFVEAPKGRGAQLAAGAAVARGEWLLFLHADTVLSENWVEAARAHISSGPSRAGWFRLDFDAAGPAAAIIAAWANLRSRLGLPYGDQGLLIHRSLYRAVGGHPPIPLMEDVALAPLNATATTSAERYAREGWLRRGARNLLTLARYFLGASPESLAKSYHRR